MEGIGWFSYESLKRITCRHPEHKFIFIFDRAWSDEFIFSGNIIPVVAAPQARHPILWYLYFEWSIPSVLRKHKADVFLSPDGWLSLRTDVPSLPVIHDLNFENYPEFIPSFVRKYYHYFFPRFARKAARIGTVSEFTRRDIVKRYGIDPQKIDVLYNGANETFQPLPHDEQQKIREEYTQGCPYFLFVGLIHPRKNLARQIMAFDRFKERIPCNVKLLVAGSKKWWTDDIRRTYENSPFRNEIIFAGRVNADRLKFIYASALALTYVSIFEGFGIPILEAMACDIPVITSESSSMPEVGGNAVLYADPFSVDSIASAMMKIFNDEKLRNLLIEKGRIQRNNFSWEKTAGNLWNCIEKTMTEKNIIFL